MRDANAIGGSFPESKLQCGDVGVANSEMQTTVAFLLVFLLALVNYFRGRAIDKYCFYR